MSAETKKHKPSRRRRGCLVALGVLGVFGLAIWVVYGGGQHEGPGEVTDVSVPEASVHARADRQASSGAEGSDQILFGDLHVHTTFSADAFMLSLPLMGGEGAHPPADACDFARHCSGLDFFALTDHAEALTPEHWRESIESIRRCNEVAGDPEDPDLVAFVGFEWTNVGRTPEEHYGHKNVIFRDLEDDELPLRPIAARGIAAAAMNNPIAAPWIPLVPILELSERQRYLDLAQFFRENAGLDACPSGIDTRELPVECRETATTPAALFEKLDQWGFPALVIPHGTTWGFYTPPGYTWDKQIAAEQDDPERQRLIEIFSGHGNSEEYRPWRATTIDGETLSCPEPSEGYEPCCWRAGEIIRARCDEPESEACEARVQTARQSYTDGRVAGHLSLPDVAAEEWGNCGQCTDCFLPSFNYRPAGSAQYALARGNFDDPEAPRHHVMGFMASSDNHTARPGTGYKEMNRYHYSESRGPRTREWRDRVWGERPPASPEARVLDPEWLMEQPPFRVVEFERQASFFLTGGLVAVHSEGRDRQAIWDALQRRQTYGTSGPRILLWFDLIGDSEHPMGSEVPFGAAPRFRVRAAGSFEQLDGCPDASVDALGAERLENVCRNECWNPSETRIPITRIEVVRIRPQIRDDESIEELVEDVWQTLPCEGTGDLCTVEFDDPEFTESGRDALYYVRAIQAPTPTVNGGNLRCDDEGECEPCWGDFRNPMTEDCLAPNEERAWSSPIWLRFDESLVPPPEEPVLDGGVGGTP